MIYADEEIVLDWWCIAVERAYKLALAERLDALRGERKIRPFDSRMVHPFSEQLGAAMALSALLPELTCLELDALQVRREAERDARDQFAREEAERLGYELK
jgi:hypothetical protein